MIGINPSLNLNRLKLSGDVEENPGPPKASKTQTIHLKTILLITMLLIWIYSLNIRQNSNIKNATTKISLQNKLGYVKLSILKRKTPVKSTAKYLFIIILLVSNDVEPNPGPPTTDKCNICQLSTQTTSKLKCNTCDKTYHKKCVNTQNIISTASILWICTEPNCAPNHLAKLQTEATLSTNRFTALLNVPIINSEPDNGKKLSTKELPNKETYENLYYLNHLPLISSTDYIGNPRCSICTSRIRKLKNTVS